LMLVYTLLDPLVLAAQNVLLATGHPDFVLRTRIFQTVIFLPAVIGLGAVWGIEGVAIAANLMVLVGTIFLFQKTRAVVDYSSRALWLLPLVGLILIGVVIFLTQDLWIGFSTWIAFFGKVSIISLLYFGFLLLVERTVIWNSWLMVWNLIKPQKS